MMYDVDLRRHVLNVLREHERCSLNFLCKAVKQRLGKQEQRIGTRRIKSLIFKDAKIRVRVVGKKGGCENLNVINKCKACGSNKLRCIYERDLKGNRILNEKRCNICGFRMTPGKCNIRLYEISLKRI